MITICRSELHFDIVSFLASCFHCCQHLNLLSERQSSTNNVQQRVDPRHILKGIVSASGIKLAMHARGLSYKMAQAPPREFLFIVELSNVILFSSRHLIRKYNSRISALSILRTPFSHRAEHAVQ